jgi:hypothetical protein
LNRWPGFSALPVPCILAVNGSGRSPMSELGKTLLGLGLLLALVGAALLLVGRMGLPLGRLPGDITWRGKHVSVFFPLGTSILISIILSVLFYLFSHLRR